MVKMDKTLIHTSKYFIIIAKKTVMIFNNENFGIMYYSTCIGYVKKYMNDKTLISISIHQYQYQYQYINKRR